jgi:polyisoprenyl-phosphate glycosyltransferase
MGSDINKLCIRVRSMQSSNLTIITPVFNDWESLSVLAGKIAGLPALQAFDVTLVGVDDGSREVHPPAETALTGCLAHVAVVRLNSNLGHQRAIALGLAYVHEKLSPDLVVVMDSDGEDSPQVIGDMLAAQATSPGAIIVAQRVKRSENFVFRAFYAIYKNIFRSLTGRPISFGNFSLIPAARLPNLLFNSGIWNNFAATILKCRLDIVFVPTVRGKRYAGESRMNFTSLMIHGFSAISVFTDVVIGRILFLLVALSVLTAAGVIGVIAVKLFSDVFVPGYATNVILFMVSLLGMALFTGFLLVLSLLAARERPAALPTQLMKDHVREVVQVTARHHSGRAVS